MNQKVNILMLALAGVFQQVMMAEINGETKSFINPKWFESPDLPFFNPGIKQLDFEDHFGEANRIYVVSIRTRKVVYPIDVFDIIVTKDLINLRFSGIELPICTANGLMVLEGDQFTRLMQVAIESNWDLMEALKSHKGGPSEIKSTGK